MGAFLKPLTKELVNLQTNGKCIIISHNKLQILMIGFIVDLPRSIKFKAFQLCFISDLPAKASVLNLTQFNGYWGCARCEQKGEKN